MTRVRLQPDPVTLPRQDKTRLSARVGAGGSPAHHHRDRQPINFHKEAFLSSGGEPMPSLFRRQRAQPKSQSRATLSISQVRLRCRRNNFSVVRTFLAPALPAERRGVQVCCSGVYRRDVDTLADLPVGPIPLPRTCFAYQCSRCFMIASPSLMPLQHARQDVDHPQAV